jgi:type I restriction enzyme S subunit
MDTISYVNQRVAKIICKYINPKYLYYWYISCDIENKVLELAKGTAQPNISTNELSHLKIPIPPLDRQQEIVKYLDFIYEKCIKTSTEKILELKQLNEICLNTQKMFGENSVKMLGEVCKVNQGTYIKHDMKIEGEYPVYGGGNISYHINQFNRENEIIVAKDGVSADCVRYETGKFFLNHHGWTIICTDIITKKYMFYTLQSIQSQLLSIAKGTAQLGINQENFYKLKIPIPSLARQKEIVDYCEFNDTLIQQLEKEIEQNKKQANLFISGIVKTVGYVNNELVEDVPSTPIAEEAPTTPVVEEVPQPKKMLKILKKRKINVTPSEE